MQTFQTKYCILICYRPSVSNLDAPYIIAKIPISKYQHHYKFIETSKISIFKNTLMISSNLPFSIVYSFDNPDDQLDILNKTILECIEHHAPLKRTKFTRPPPPWMKKLDIVALQNQSVTKLVRTHQKCKRKQV